MQLKLVLADPHLVALLEAGVAQRRNHPHLGESLLQVGERFGIGEIVALEQHLDPPPLDPKGSFPLALYPVALLSTRAVDAMLGLELRRSAIWWRDRRRGALGGGSEDRPAQRLQ